MRVDRDPGPLTGADPRRVDLVHRRADVDALGVEDVDHRRHRQRGRRRRGPLADLGGDLGDNALERRLEDGLCQFGSGDADRCPCSRLAGRCCTAGRAAGLPAALDLVEQIRRDDLLVGQPLHAIVLACGALCGQTDPLTLGGRRLQVAFREIETRSLGAVLDPEHDPAGLDDVALAVG